MGSFLWVSGGFPGSRLPPSPEMAPSIKTSLLLLSPQSGLQPTSSTQLAQPGPSQFPSLHPRTPAPSLHTRSFLLPFPRETLNPSLGLPCYLSSPGLLKLKHLEESLPSDLYQNNSIMFFPQASAYPGFLTHIPLFLLNTTSDFGNAGSERTFCRTPS